MITWEYVPKYYLQGSHGYRISRNRSGGDRVVYQAWPPKPARGKVHHAMGLFLDVEEAKTCCLNHFKGEKNV